MPDSLCAVETFGDDPAAYLLPAEEPIVARAVEKRRREVTNARSCARRALRQLTGGQAGDQGPEPAILRGERGEPLWPDGVIGSITHTAGYCAAVVGAAGETRSVGIDAEPNGPLPDGVLAHVAFGAELDELAGLDNRPAAGPGVHWDRLLFSAKESVYKAWYPLTRRWLGFEDAVLRFAPAERTFHATILIDPTTLDGPPLTELSGRFLVRDGLLATAVVVPHVPRSGEWRTVPEL